MLDPLRRLALDAQLRLAAAKKARFSSYDAKRKTMVSELEERERELKKTRLDKEKERATRENENERVKEAGRRLKEEKERERAERERVMMEKTRPQAEQEDPDSSAPPPLGPYDTTIRIKFPLAKFPTLDTPSALASHLARFGEIDENAIVLLIKPKKSGKKEKSTAAKQGDPEMIVNAAVTFTQISAAFGAISSRPKLKEQGMDVTWATGSEPLVLQWLRDRGELGGKASDKMGGNPAADAAAKSQQTPQGSQASDFTNSSNPSPTYVSSSVPLFSLSCFVIGDFKITSNHSLIHCLMLTPLTSLQHCLHTLSPPHPPNPTPSWIMNLSSYYVCVRPNAQSWNAKYWKQKQPTQSHEPLPCSR